MLLEEVDHWLDLMNKTQRFEVFKILSEYLSSNELKSVMESLNRGNDILLIHRNMGLIRKYYVDLIRIHNTLN